MLSTLPRFSLEPARPEDARALTDLARRTYFETFAKDNTPENMAAYLAETFSEEKQRREILDPKRQIVMAWAAETPSAGTGPLAAGFYQLYEGTPDASVRGPKPIELLRLYIDQNYLGTGLGARLMDHAIASAQAQGFRTLWLGVWEINFRAQAFYRKYGFERVGEHPFPMGTDIQTDYVMVKSLE